MENKLKLSRTQRKIYDTLKLSGEDGTTSSLALIKLIYPLGMLHIVYKTSKPILWIRIAQLNKKIENHGEKIISMGARQGYTLINL